MNFASDTFSIDRVYRRRHILAVADVFEETADGMAVAIVANRRPGLVPVAFEFSKVSGAKFKCYGIGKAARLWNATRFPKVAAYAQSAEGGAA